MQATLSPERRVTGAGEFRLNISVVHTSDGGTSAALKMAAALATRLGGRITLMAPEVVSYQLPLHEPPVKREWSERRLRALAAETTVETTVQFYLCRDKEETLTRELKPHSLVIIGGKRHWWPTSERRLAGKLRRLGHEVIFAETE